MSGQSHQSLSGWSSHSGWSMELPRITIFFLIGLLVFILFEVLFVTFYFVFFNLISSSASEHPETIWGWVIVTSSWVYLGIKETQTFCRWGIGNCLSQMCLLHWPKQGSLRSPGCSIWTKPRDPQPAAHTVSAGWKKHFFGFLSSFQTERCVSRNFPAWFSCKAIMCIIPTAFVSSAHCTPWQDKLIKRIYFLKSLL